MIDLTVKYVSFKDFGPQALKIPQTEDYTAWPFHIKIMYGDNSEKELERNLYDPSYPSLNC